MIFPPLSILCPTYGRTACVRELLECFRRTTYPGKLELVLLNDVPEQTLSLEPLSLPDKNTCVINKGERYPSLGDKRNACVLLARHEHFLFVDDDDIFMPWYPASMMRMFLDDEWQKPVYPLSYIHAEGKGAEVRMTYKAQSHPASYLATRQQFNDVGGYPFVYAGGDQIIRSKLFKKYDCAPHKHPNPITIPGYVYRWGNGTYHISGSADHGTAWSRTQASLHRRMDTGEEPCGLIEIRPGWDVDYQDLYAKVMP